jgi:hypothetical protein
MLLVFPLYLYSFLAVHTFLRRRPTLGLYLTAAVLVSILGAPASTLLWVSGPSWGVAAQAIASIVLALPAFLLLVWIRHTSGADGGKTAMGVVLCLVGCLILLPSSLSWLALPFSIAFLPFAGFSVATGVIFSLGWWFLSQRSAADVPEANSRALTLICLSALIGLTVALAMHAVIRGRTRTVTRVVEWESGGSRQRCGAPVLLIDRQCTVLTYRACSDAVAQYLRSTGSRTVPVTYSVADDFGRLWSYTVTQIGQMRVDFKADESVRKENAECIFHPEKAIDRRSHRHRR